MLEEISGVTCYVDDICMIWGNTKESHDARPGQV
jgi:hypothetical protein